MQPTLDPRPYATNPRPIPKSCLLPLLLPATADRGLSLLIPAGCKVALVGSSGSGKSSVVQVRDEGGGGAGNGGEVGGR